MVVLLISGAMMPSVLLLGEWKTLPLPAREAIPLTVRVYEARSSDQWLERMARAHSITGIAVGTLVGYRRLALQCDRFDAGAKSEARRLFVLEDEAVLPTDDVPRPCAIGRSGEHRAGFFAAHERAAGSALAPALSPVSLERAAQLLPALLAESDPAVESLADAAALFSARFALSAAQRRVLSLLLLGCSAGEIAERLSIAQRTAEHHLEHVRARVGVASSAEIVAMVWAEFARMRGVGARTAVRSA